MEKRACMDAIRFCSNGQSNGCWSLHVRQLKAAHSFGQVLSRIRDMWGLIF